MAQTSWDRTAVVTFGYQKRWLQTAR